MPRYIAYISTIVPVFVIAEDEDAAYSEVETHINSYISDNFNLDTVIENASIEYVEYDSEVPQKKKKSMNERVISASIRYLNIRGYEIIDSKLDNDELPFDIVCSIDDEIAFVDTHYNVDNMPEEESKSRAEFEKAVAAWCAKNIEIDIQKIRYDVISMHIMESNSKALLRHHINALGPANEN